MNYVIYDKETTRYLRVLRRRNWEDAIYRSLSAVKAAYKRHMKAHPEDMGKYGMASLEWFTENIEKTVTVKSLMNGAEIRQPINTPRCCDPSTELYWSM